MPKFEALKTNSVDSSDWDRAWALVSRLAAARGATLPPAAPELAMSHEPQWTALPTPSARAKLRDRHAAQPSARIAPDQLARDMAEIEQAAAALRRAEPTLEPRRPALDAMPDVRSVRSVWLLIALIWLSAASVVSGAIGAVLLFLG
jgi:hypothetical protein